MISIQKFIKPSNELINFSSYGIPDTIFGVLFLFIFLLNMRFCLFGDLAKIFVSELMLKLESNIYDLHKKNFTEFMCMC